MLERLRAELADRYRIERELGRGGMATVWLAQDLRHDRPVAIKVLQPELASAIGVDRFVREVRFMARLQHPCIVPVLDSGKLLATDDVPLPWYAMPFVTGESLRTRLQREVQLPIDEAVRIARDVAGALRTAHAEGVIHRDIKPENIILSGTNVYVVDFGIAKALLETGEEHITSTGIALGTPTYMSPEQSSAATVDERTDQYSLAAVLYEMLVGEPPITGPTGLAIIARRFAEPARPIRPVRSAVPEHIEAAVLKALERVPADRFPNIAAFAAQLEPNTSPIPMTSTRPMTAATPMARAPRGRRFLVPGIVLIAAVSLAAWAVVKQRSSPPPDPQLLALYQRGVQGYDRRTPDGARDAIAAFSAALARDSTFAHAWVGLAKTYVRVNERGFELPGLTTDSIGRLAIAAVNRALALTKTDAEAWAAQASVMRIVDPTDVNPAIRAAQRAIALDSSNGPAWHFLALSLAETGEMNAALDAWRECVRRNPTFTLGLAFLSQAHYWHKQFDSARVWADSALALDPTYVLGRTLAGLVAVEQTNTPRAIAAFDAARRVTSGLEAAGAIAHRAFAEARGQRIKDARADIRVADSVASRYSVTPLHTAVYLAYAYAALGDARRSVAWLQRYQVPDDLHFQLHIRCDPPFAALASDPRYQALLVKPTHGTGC